MPEMVWNWMKNYLQADFPEHMTLSELRIVCMFIHYLHNYNAARIQVHLARSDVFISCLLEYRALFSICVL